MATTTITRPNDPVEIIGWVRQGDCQNPTCKRDTAAGLPWHAIPAGFATTLPGYHFRTEADAMQAIHNRMRNVRGLRMDMDTTGRIAWMNANGGVL